ncbi:MAG: hypothetical protein QJR05_09735 [Thermoanaerobacterium sp.]|nr:hypothetical protein [Thermoanaerobacterium sp.]
MKSNNKLENFIKALDRLKEGLLQYDKEDEREASPSKHKML